MYRYFFILALIFLSHPVFAERTIVTTKPYFRPYYSNPQTIRRNYINPRHYNSHHYPRYTTDFSDMNAIEKYALNKTYSKESPLERLQRLEMQAFGAVQSGDIDSRYENVRNAILSRPNYTNTKTSLLRNIGNFFAGQMTGYTPQINSYPTSGLNYTQYPTTFGNGSYTEFSGPFHSGYYNNNFNTGSGCGVKILD